MPSDYGWSGSLLSIDLSDRRVTTLPVNDYAQRFLGGIGIAEKIYWDAAPAAASAFDAGNPLILMTGPLAGTSAPGAPRTVACGRSPCIYPETFASASLGGFFAAELKKAGYDGIVLRGQSEKPVYLHIDNGRVEIRDAGHLWGQTNSATHAAIRQEVGSRARIVSIGPAAENRTRIGILFTDVAGAGSVGFGSIMGSKNLKAIAVQGTRTIPVADPERIRQIRTRIRQMRGEGFFNLYGTPITLPGTQVVRPANCHGCPQGCWRTIHRDAAGTESVRKCQTGLFYTLWDKKLHNGAITEASFRAPDLANEYSLCIMDLVFLLLWLDRCFAGGILTEKQAELPLSKMGSIEFLQQMIQKICSREGFGAVLAEGALRASEIVGPESREITRNLLNQTGRAIAYGPKVFSLSALIYATEPRPAIAALHEVCEPLTKWALWYTSQGQKSYVSTEVLRGIAENFWGGRQAVDFSTYEGKARASLLIQNRLFAKESLILCDFAWPLYDDASTPGHVGDPTMESQLLSAVVGQDIDHQELNRFAERSFNLYRAIHLREGRRGRADDILPDFFFVERDEMIADVFGMHNPNLYLPGAGDEVISRKGKAVDREKFEKLKDEYYHLRGWDVQTGLPKKDTLRSLDLAEVIEPLGEKVV
jgi:aldehyde:ferredoxin oxidoreductase